MEQESNRMDEDELREDADCKKLICSGGHVCIWD